MATKAGLLGFSPLDAFNGIFKPYTVATGNKAAVTATLCNTSASQVKVSLGYTSPNASSPTSGQWLIGGGSGYLLSPGQLVQVSTMLGAGQGLAASSSAGGVSFTVNGIEEAL